MTERTITNDCTQTMIDNMELSAENQRLKDSIATMQELIDMYLADTFMEDTIKELEDTISSLRATICDIADENERLESGYYK